MRSYVVLYGSSILISDLFINYLPNLKHLLYSFRITDPTIKRERIMIIQLRATL